MKLEIGCGENRNRGAGWQYLDARNLPHVDYVQDARDLSNLKSDTYSRIVAENIIEHIPWREVVPTLKEWLRVIRLGGKLELSTPNAMELVLQITDPHNTNLRRWNQESNWQRFSRTAFGHQDYPGNFHTTYFTPEWLEEVVLEAGAKSVTIIEDSLENIRLEATK